MDKRNTSLDLIRITAFVLVVCVHSLLNGGFYYHTVQNPLMIVILALRSVFMCCVPLFLVLSGYLTVDKKYDKKFYKRIIRIVFVYLFSSLFCELYRVFFMSQSFGIKGFIANVLAYKAAPYSWYVHMYFGLFLMFPFFNACWKGLETKKKRAALVLTMIVLTALPSVINTFDLSTPGWWAQPSVSDKYTQIIPDWWQPIYPITYYFVGCWLKTYPPKKRTFTYLLLTVGFAALFGLYDYYRSYGSNFVWKSFTDHYGYQSLILTVLIFVFWLSVNANRLPRTLRAALSFISDLTLGAYLLSWIFDQITYPRIAVRYPEISQRYIYFPECILISVLGSLVLSANVWVLWKLFEKLLDVIKKKIGKPKPSETERSVNE